MLSESSVDQWNSICSRSEAAIRAGDVLSAVNGICEIESIIKQCQRFGVLMLEIVRRPFKIRRLEGFAPKDGPNHGGSSAENPTSPIQIEAEMELLSLDVN